jgi:hypothetical protein
VYVPAAMERVMIDGRLSVFLVLSLDHGEGSADLVPDASLSLETSHLAPRLYGCHMQKPGFGFEGSGFREGQA